MCSSCTSSIVTYRCPASFYPWRHLRINGPRPTARPAELLPTAFHQRPGKPDPWFGRYRRSSLPWEPWSRPSIPKMTLLQPKVIRMHLYAWLDFTFNLAWISFIWINLVEDMLFLLLDLDFPTYLDLDFQAGIPNQPENGVFSAQIFWYRL